MGGGQAKKQKVEVMDEAEDEVVKIEEELAVKKDKKIAAEVEETKRVALLVRQEVKRFLTAVETERLAEAAVDMDSTKIRRKDQCTAGILPTNRCGLDRW